MQTLYRAHLHVTLVEASYAETSKGLLGVSADPYPGKINKETGKLEQGKRILTSPIFDFLYDGKGMGFAQDPILEDTKEAGFWKSLINLTNLKNPDGTSLMPFLDADAEWRKDFFTNQNAWFESFKKNLFGLLDTDYIEKFDDFMKNDFRTFMEGLVPNKETRGGDRTGRSGETRTSIVRGHNEGRTYSVVQRVPNYERHQ